MALEIDAGYAQAYCNRGITWAETGDLERGLNDAQKALSLEPKNRSYQKIVAFLKDQIGSKKREGQ
jgi:hypothetical protein